MNLIEESKKIWDFYNKRKAIPSLEPCWIHPDYDVIRKICEGVDVDKKEIIIAKNIVSSFYLKDGYEVRSHPNQPNSSTRIIHDGVKAGSAAWIFIGRSFEGNSQLLQDGWVVVKRTLPDEIYKLIDSDLAPATLWLAYHLEKQQIIGPAIYLEDIKKIIFGR